MKEEIWIPIKKFNNEYEISNLGRLRSTYSVIERSNGRSYIRNSKILKPALDGYLKGAVCVNKKIVSYKIHRLVAECFLPNIENKSEVNHINGIKTDNRVENLEWCTRQENIQHCVLNKLQTPFKGEEVGNSILKEYQIKEIRSKFIPRKYSRKKLSLEYNVSEATIKDIIYKRTWKHLL
jgi:hypothetical protein